MNDSSAEQRLFDRLSLHLPVVIAEVEVGGRTWKLASVESQDALLDVADEFAHTPYGLLLWPAAVGLGRLLAGRGADLAGKSVLELGAGLGLPGIVARSLGADVVQTDHAADALALARLNARRNGVDGIRYSVADWTTWRSDTRYDLVIGADILYERAMHFHLQQVFERAVAGSLIISDPVRPQAMEFMAGLEHAGWRIELDTTEVEMYEHEAAGKQIALMTCRRPG